MISSAANRFRFATITHPLPPTRRASHSRAGSVYGAQVKLLVNDRPLLLTVVAFAVTAFVVLVFAR